MARMVWDDAELNRLLNSENGPVGRDLRRKGKVVERGAKRRCPVSEDGSHGNDPGHLRDSIGSEMGRDAEGMYAQVGTDVDYALFPELGTRPHVIESHGDYPLRNRKTGQVFGRKVNHPGTTAQPYLRPALDDLRGE